MTARRQILLRATSEEAGPTAHGGQMAFPWESARGKRGRLSAHFHQSAASQRNTQPFGGIITQA